MLEFLDLQHIHGITWAGIASLGRIEIKGGCVTHGCPKLCAVRMTECDASEKQIRALAANLPFGRSAGNRRGITSVPHGHRVQNEYIWTRHTEEVAATYLQTNFRGWKSRRETLAYALKRAEEMRKRIQACILILQCMARARMVRSHRLLHSLTHFLFAHRHAGGRRNYRG